MSVKYPISRSIKHKLDRNTFTYIWVYLKYIHTRTNMHSCTTNLLHRNHKPLNGVEGRCKCNSNIKRTLSMPAVSTAMQALFLVFWLVKTKMWNFSLAALASKRKITLQHTDTYWNCYFHIFFFSNAKWNFVTFLSFLIKHYLTCDEAATPPPTATQSAH